MVGRAISVFVAALGDFMRAWPQLLATDVIYKIIAFVVLTPLVGGALRIFLSTSGSAVVADQDILYFVLSPIGLITLVVVGTVSLAIVSLEEACLMAIGFGRLRGLHVSTADALWYGVSHTWSILVLATRILIRVLLIATPFLAAGGLLYLLLLGNHDINYYLAERPPVFLLTAGVIASLLTVMAVLVIRRLLAWSFALPLLLFEGLGPAEAMTASEHRVRGHRWIVASVLVAWGAGGILLSALPPAVAGTVGRWTVPTFAGSMGVLVVVVGGILVLWGALNLLVTMVNSALFALLTVRLYDSFGSSDEAQLSKLKHLNRTETTNRRRISAKAVVAGLAVAAIATTAVGHLLVNRVRMDDDVVVIAHRGAAGRAPENTLASVAAAIEDGTDVVEIDVQETADGRVIVIHDSDFMRVGGVALNVWDGTFDEVRQIDIGSWFGAEFSDQRPPTLAEVLEMCKGKAHLDIELKYYGHDQMLEQRVVDIVELAGMTDQMVVMSLKHEAVQKMKELRPGWTVGLLTAKAVGDLTRSDADFLAVHTGIANPGFVRRAHRAGKDVYVWTVNDRINMSRMMSWGVDGLITDEPALAKEVIAERAEMSSAERLVVAAAFWIGLKPKEPPPELDLG